MNTQQALAPLTHLPSPLWSSKPELIYADLLFWFMQNLLQWPEGWNNPSRHSQASDTMTWTCRWASVTLHLLILSPGHPHNRKQYWGANPQAKQVKAWGFLSHSSSSKRCKVSGRTPSCLPCELTLMVAIKLLLREARPRPPSEPAALPTRHYFHTVKPWFPSKHHFGSVFCCTDPMSSPRATKTSGAGNCLERHFDPHPGCCHHYTGN